ncbi:DNA polymerase III epsilon subunit [Sandaracinus amylolyticus]|uniref:DNA polymerase III epsilon subunit n=1 Tax=Sandaracinus amylolyticus TaxID=927083 RepID=A0A0F6W6J1_9BACT|nr:DNA polymerase III epsilon subunit [Sandaracinus amylolyticus]
MALAFLDLEMTGCDPANDRICEVAIHRVVGGEVVDRVVSLIDPGVSVGASVEVHGITDAMLAGAPLLEALSARIGEVLEGAVVIGHAIAFDLAFLRAAVARGELAWAPEVAIDTRGLAQRALRVGSASLAALAQDLALPRPTHRAEPDVLATRALFDAICEVLRPETARHLLLAQDVGGRATLRGDVEATLRDAHAQGRAVRVCYRVPGRRAIEDLFDVWALEPPRVEGWLHDKQVQRALRGDRLLWVEATDEPVARTAPAGWTPTIPRRDV